MNMSIIGSSWRLEATSAVRFKFVTRGFVFLVLLTDLEKRRQTLKVGGWGRQPVLHAARSLKEKRQHTGGEAAEAKAANYDSPTTLRYPRKRDGC